MQTERNNKKKRLSKPVRKRSCVDEPAPEGARVLHHRISQPLPLVRCNNTAYTNRRRRRPRRRCATHGRSADRFAGETRFFYRPPFSKTKRRQRSELARDSV